MTTRFVKVGKAFKEVVKCNGEDDEDDGCEAVDDDTVMDDIVNDLVNRTVFCAVNQPKIEVLHIVY